MQISGRAQAMTNFLSEKQRIRRWIERQGVQIHDATPKESEAVRQILKDTPRLFPDLLYRSGLRLLFLYEQDETQENDGVCWIDVTRDGHGVLYAIGLATWTLENPPYFQLVFLHELAHIAVGGEHNAAFRAYLDSLIAKFNEATGVQLVNDYPSEGGAKQ